MAHFELLILPDSIALEYCLPASVKSCGLCRSDMNSALPLGGLSFVARLAADYQALCHTSVGRKRHVVAVGCNANYSDIVYIA